MLHLQSIHVSRLTPSSPGVSTHHFFHLKDRIDDNLGRMNTPVAPGSALFAVLGFLVSYEELFIPNH